MRLLEYTVISVILICSIGSCVFRQTANPINTIAYNIGYHSDDMKRYRFSVSWDYFAYSGCLSDIVDDIIALCKRIIAHSCHEEMRDAQMKQSRLLLQQMMTMMMMTVAVVGRDVVVAVTENRNDFRRSPIISDIQASRHHVALRRLTLTILRCGD